MKYGVVFEMFEARRSKPGSPHPYASANSKKFARKSDMEYLIDTRSSKATTDDTDPVEEPLASKRSNRSSVASKRFAAQK